MIEDNSAQNVFSAFINIIKQNPELRTILVEILNLDTQHRKDELDIFLFNPSIILPAEQIQQIFDYLLDDYFSQEVLKYLAEEL